MLGVFMSKPLSPPDYESDQEHQDSTAENTQQQVPLGVFSGAAIDFSEIPPPPQNNAGLAIQIPANDHVAQVSPTGISEVALEGGDEWCSLSEDSDGDIEDSEDEPELPPAPPNSLANNPSGGFFSQNQQGGGRGV